MTNTKQAKFIIDVSAEKKRVTESSVRFFSYDSKTAEIIIQAEKEEQLISKSIVSNVEIFFESVDASFQPTDKLKWKDQMTVVADGLFSYLLPDELLNYQGLVAFEIYINYTNNDKSDSSYRIVYAQRSSAIDRAAGEIELVYIKDFEALKKEVADKAAEVKESLAGYDSGLDIYADQKKTEMDAFSTSVGTLASAEKLKIQAELPKVQQTSTSETTKIKAELPKVQAVATAEIGKIKAVLPTVENAATEVSDYADQKIIEYDAKLEESNQSITALSQNLSDLKAEMQLSDAYAWSEDGTDRFTTIKPRENLLKNGRTTTTITSNNGTTYPISAQILTENGESFVRVKRTGLEANNATYSVFNAINIGANLTQNISSKRVEVSCMYRTSHEINMTLMATLTRPTFTFPDNSRLIKSSKDWQQVSMIIGEFPTTQADTLVRFLPSYASIAGIADSFYIDYKNWKISIIEDDSNEASAYTAPPTEDYPNSFPHFIGTNLADSDNPADYIWEYTDEYVDYLREKEVASSKTESSTNVVYQLIGKEKVLMTLTLDMKNKISGSLVENKNSTYRSQFSSLLPVVHVGWVELTQRLQDKLVIQDVDYADHSTATSGYMALIKQNWNILAILKEKLGEDFFLHQGAPDVTSQVAIVRSIVKKSKNNFFGFGSGSTGNKVTMSAWNAAASAWQGAQTSTASTVTQISMTVGDPGVFIDSTGTMNFIAYAEPSDGSIASIINIDYTSLEITIELSMNEFIKSMIANYNKSLVAQINDIAGRVSALENK